MTSNIPNFKTLVNLVLFQAFLKRFSNMACQSVGGLFKSHRRGGRGLGAVGMAPACKGMAGTTQG